MNISNIEKTLKARHVGSYAPGHMGSQILRFQRNKDGKTLVVKFAPKDNATATADFKANIRGYTEITKIGGVCLVPLELKEISVTSGRALVMRDLGASMRVQNSGISSCVLLWKHLRRVIALTTVQTKEDKAEYPRFVLETIHHIKRFLHGTTQDLPRLMQKSDWTGGWGKSALMLCDFTPDNLFVNKAKLSFIDPWSQNTYLGHPAVSVGQFATLMRLYHMKDADKAALILKECCIEEMSAMLGCGTSSTERAFRVGSTLQLTLSSYVRRESDPPLAAELAEKARKLW